MTETAKYKSNNRVRGVMPPQREVLLPSKQEHTLHGIRDNYTKAAEQQGETNNHNNNHSIKSYHTRFLPTTTGLRHSFHTLQTSHTNNSASFSETYHNPHQRQSGNLHPIQQFKTRFLRNLINCLNVQQQHMMLLLLLQPEEKSSRIALSCW